MMLFKIILFSLRKYIYFAYMVNVIIMSSDIGLNDCYDMYIWHYGACGGYIYLIKVFTILYSSSYSLNSFSFFKILARLYSSMKAGLNISREYKLNNFVFYQQQNRGRKFGTRKIHLSPRWLRLLSVLKRLFCCC